MRVFYDNLDQVYRIVSSNVVILQKNRKHYLDIQRPLIFRCLWYGHQRFKLFDPKEDLPKVT